MVQQTPAVLLAPMVQMTVQFQEAEALLSPLPHPQHGAMVRGLEDRQCLLCVEQLLRVPTSSSSLFLLLPAIQKQSEDLAINRGRNLIKDCC